MAAGFILNNDTRHACSTAGLATVKDQATTVSDLIQFVQQQIDSIDADRKAASMWNKAELVTKAVKATADAFIEMAAAATGAEGEKVQKAYSVASDFGSGTMKLVNGQSGTAEVVKSVLGYVDAKVSPAEASHLETCLHDFSKTITNNMIDGFNGDAAGVVKNTRNTAASCTSEGVKAAAKSKFKDKAVGEKVGKALGAGVVWANAAYTYSEELDKAVDEWSKNEDEIDRFEDWKRQLLGQLRQLKQKLAQLNQTILACAAVSEGEA